MVTSTMLGELKHENLSSILATENEVFSFDEDAPPTFREQKERTGNFFLTEKLPAYNRREDNSGTMLFQFKDENLCAETDDYELLY